MKSLSHDTRCDEEIERELTRARIDIVRAELPADREVPARLSGKLGPFDFYRGWYYWIVTGPMPLNLAVEMYEDPIGREDIRAAGHCMAPHPSEWTASWSDSEGRRSLVVHSYHIDTGEGLRLFADYARKAVTK